MAPVAMAALEANVLKPAPVVISKRRAPKPPVEKPPVVEKAVVDKPRVEKPRVEKPPVEKAAVETKP